MTPTGFRRRLARRVAAVLVLLGLAGCGAGLLPAVHSDTERLALAKRLRDQRKFAPAIELLKTHIDLHGGSADVDEAIYVLGQCELGIKDWIAASASFERLLRDYPESDSAASASFRLGEALFGQTRPQDFDQEYTTRAILQWQSYLRSYPGHWLNGEAETRIARARTRLASKLLSTGKLYLKLKRPGPARVYFERVRDEYADTPVLGEALIGLALCEAREGRKGEAVERLRRLESEFPGQPIARAAARERARLER